MKYLRILLFLLLTAVCAALWAAGLAAASSDEWRPIDPAELAMKTSLVEKDADAEAIFWEVHVADEVDGGTPRTVLTQYIRIKILSERGRESQSKIDIPYLKNWSIKDIAARTIKPNGTIVELKKEDVFDRTVVKASGVKRKAKSFAMPEVEAGSIIEYRWKEVRNDRLANYIRLPFQREIPVESIKYFIKPLTLEGFPYGMRVRTFHGTGAPFTKEKDGFYSTEMKNVPAFREEPRMPPEDSVRPWMLVYYSEDKKLTSDQFWADFGKRVYEGNKARTKVNDEVKQAAAKAIGDATSPEQKLERLFEFCRTNIKNASNISSGLTAEERAAFKSNKTPAETLKRGIGSFTDIDMLFTALATAAGLDARIVNLGDRSDTFFDKSFPDDYFMVTYDIAVRVGDSWRFYDPASTYVAMGMLRWQEEGQDALVSDPKEPIWIKTPLSPPDKSKQKRVAKLKLSEDGTLEGDVRVEYYGHFAADQKNFNDEDSSAQREQTLRDLIKGRMSTAELSEITIENVTDPVKPFIYKYHVRVPGYAQRTGKRIFLQPEYFEKGNSPLFPNTDRRNSVYFHYPWSEEDDVVIDLPSGYTLESPDAPVPFKAGDIGEYKPSMKVTTDGRTFIYKREFFFGGGEVLLFPVSSYPTLKAFFDRIDREDNHTITLKQAGPATSN